MLSADRLAASIFTIGDGTRNDLKVSYRPAQKKGCVEIVSVVALSSSRRFLHARSRTRSARPSRSLRYRSTTRSRMNRSIAPTRFGVKATFVSRRTRVCAGESTSQASARRGSRHPQARGPAIGQGLAPRRGRVAPRLEDSGLGA